MTIQNEVCPTCKRPTKEAFRPTKHAKVKATYGRRGSIYYSAYMDRYKTSRQHHFPAFKAKVSRAPYYTRGWSNSNRTSMSCPDPWHDEQHEKRMEEIDAKLNAKENAEENRKKFLALRLSNEYEFGKLEYAIVGVTDDDFIIEVTGYRPDEPEENPTVMTDFFSAYDNEYEQEIMSYWDDIKFQV